MNGICIDLHNPLSRLKTKHQMTVMKPSNNEQNRNNESKANENAKKYFLIFV
jgi:hypothetical protein